MLKTCSSTWQNGGPSRSTGLSVCDIENITQGQDLSNGGNDNSRAIADNIPRPQPCPRPDPTMCQHQSEAKGPSISPPSGSPLGGWALLVVGLVAAVGLRGTAADPADAK